MKETRNEALHAILEMVLRDDRKPVVVHDDAYPEEIDDGRHAFDVLQELTFGRFGMYLSEEVDRLATKITNLPLGTEIVNLTIFSVTKQSDGLLFDVSGGGGVMR